MSYSLFINGIVKGNVTQIIAGAKGIDRNASSKKTNIAVDLYTIINYSRVSLKDFKRIIHALPEHWLDEECLKLLIGQASYKHILDDKNFKLAIAVKYVFEDTSLEIADNLRVKGIGWADRILSGRTNYDKNIIGLIAGKNGFFDDKNTPYTLFLDNMGNLENRIKSLMCNYEGFVWEQERNYKFNRALLGISVFSVLGLWLAEKFSSIGVTNRSLNFMLFFALTLTAALSMAACAINYLEPELCNDFPTFKNTLVDLHDRTTSFVDYVTQRVSSCTRSIA